LKIGVFAGDRESESLIGCRVLCVAPVDVVAGKTGSLAQVLASTLAVTTPSACPAKPRYPDSVTWLEAVNSISCLDYLAHDLVAQNQGQLWLREVSI
jgi:hypothetical protein